MTAEIVTFKILDVAYNSPAYEAGLKMGEFIIHSPTATMKSNHDFTKALELKRL
jgi:predicted metalloprotease with PDZ domain